MLDEPEAIILLWLIKTASALLIDIKNAAIINDNN